MRDVASLRITTAFPVDIGKGIARLDTATRARLRVGVGDVIEVRGLRSTTAIVARGLPKDEGKRSIRLEPLAQRNARVRNGERVRVGRVDPPSAESLTIAPVCRSTVHFDWGVSFEAFMSKVVYYRPFVVGDVFVTSGVFLTGQMLPFVVVGTCPSGIVQVAPTTVVKTESEAVHADSVIPKPESS